jgi:hypothetical protein
MSQFLIMFNNAIHRALCRVSERSLVGAFWYDFNRLHLPGQHEWNVMTFEILLKEYGFSDG